MSIFDDMVLVEQSNFGDVVCCDGCNGPYGDNMNGGAIIGSSAYCGECCDKYGYYSQNYEYADEIDEILDKKRTFKENVLDFRKRMTGSSDAVMRIYTESSFNKQGVDYDKANTNSECRDNDRHDRERDDNNSSSNDSS